MDLAQLLQDFNNGHNVTEGTEAHDLLVHYSNEAMRITAELNSKYHTPDEIKILMENLTGEKLDESFMLFPPFYSDFGKNIHIGKTVFINACCCFQDQGGIYINDGCLIGHRVTITTLNHGLAPEDRHSSYPKPVRLGKNVWIGSGAILLPGVSIGDNAVVAAGAVVSKDVKAGSIVAGVPARHVKKIPDTINRT